MSASPGRFVIAKIAAILLVVALSVYFLENKTTRPLISKSPIILHLAEALPESNPVTVAMRLFSDLVRKKTAGGVIVKVHSSAQLGQEPEAIEQVRLGIIDMTRINSVALANVSPAIGIFTLPYIFRNFDHKYKVLDGEVGAAVRRDMAQVGLIGFDYMEAGSRSFYTRTKIIKTLADLKGLKIRVQPSRITIRMMELLGAVPTPMNFGEVYSSLSTGVVDGAENDYVSYYTSGHYEVAPFYTEDNHLSPPAILIMNRDKFNSLPGEYQQSVREAAHEAALFERDFMRESNRKAKIKMLSVGVTIYVPDTAPFRAAVTPIYQEYPVFADLIRKINETE
ncbi:TRAP-type C4-dicarboxylate transport system, periplasmic component [hydrothermal vent metagenome]|uniref:TRAP-type C4-dicarboxylate transport system, periplasmic component n=1 Tax=hydrothermal vent metagenome TaxID=652676 RepID=A0A3B0RCF8_9ZZZZ